jgi:hypothetical protein
MITALATAEVAVVPKQDDAPFGIRRRSRDGDFDPILVWRGENRKRNVPPNPHRPRRARLRHRFDAFEDFGAFRVHERRRHLRVQQAAKGEQDECGD